MAELIFDCEEEEVWQCHLCMCEYEENPRNEGSVCSKCHLYACKKCITTKDIKNNLYCKGCKPKLNNLMLKNEISIEMKTFKI